MTRPPGHGFDQRQGQSTAEALALLKLMAHEARLEILCHLIDGPLTVGELTEALGLPQPTVSQQLMRLRGEGIVSAARQGKHIRYALARAEVATVVTALREAFCARPGAPDPAC